MHQAIPKLSHEVEVGLPQRALCTASDVTTECADSSQFSILHVVEALQGGPASYLSEVLPAQESQLGRDRIGLIIPIEQREHLPGHGYFHTHYFSSRRQRLLNVISLVLAVRTWVRRYPVDVIHAQGTFAGVAVRLALHGMLRPPKVVYCAHGWAFNRSTSRWKNRLAAVAERALAHRADSIVCISAHELISAKQAGIREDRLHKIVSGISDLEPELSGAKDTAPLSVTWPLGRRRFLFVGRFDRQKGVELFLQAMESIGFNGCGIAIGRHVVKNPPSLRFPDNVIQTGWLPRDRVQAYMLSADVLVMPSHWEGFGLTAIEAMRAGKAVIATNVGGLAEIVDPGVTGLLVDPGDLAGLISAMASVSDDDVKRMGHAGRKRFLQLFHSDRMNRSLFALYRQLILQSIDH